MNVSSARSSWNFLQLLTWRAYLIHLLTHCHLDYTISLNERHQSIFNSKAFPLLLLKRKINNFFQKILQAEKFEERFPSVLPSFYCCRCYLSSDDFYRRPKPFEKCFAFCVPRLWMIKFLAWNFQGFRDFTTETHRENSNLIILLPDHKT